MSVYELQLAAPVHADSIYATDPAIKSFIDEKFPDVDPTINYNSIDLYVHPRLRVLGAVIASQAPLVIAVAGAELAPPGQKILTASAKLILGAIGARCDYEVMYGIFHKKPDTLPE